MHDAHAAAATAAGGLDDHRVADVLGNAEVLVGNVAKMVGDGLLGEEYLSWNFGIVDFDGMNLYLRPPEARPAKKR